MANFRIISNNPMVVKKYSELTTYLEISVEGIFKAARDTVHRHSVLINHPLSGSIKPNESPYKSLMLSLEKTELDFFSLRLIEGALDVLNKLPNKIRQYDERTLHDFMIIDLDLLDSAMIALPHEFH